MENRTTTRRPRPRLRVSGRGRTASHDRTPALWPDAWSLPGHVTDRCSKPSRHREWIRALQHRAGSLLAHAYPAGRETDRRCRFRSCRAAPQVRQARPSTPLRAAAKKTIVVGPTAGPGTDARAQPPACRSPTTQPVARHRRATPQLCWMNRCVPRREDRSR